MSEFQPDDPSILILWKDPKGRTKTDVLVWHDGEVYEGVLHTPAFDPFRLVTRENQDSPTVRLQWRLRPLQARRRVSRLIADELQPPILFRNIFGHGHDTPFPFEKLAGGRMYRTAKYDLICRYARSYGGYEVNGKQRSDVHGELLRTKAGQFLTVEQENMADPEMKLNPDPGEDLVKQILEDHAAERYGEFFPIEEAE